MNHESLLLLWSSRTSPISTQISFAHNLYTIVWCHSHWPENNSSGCGKINFLSPVCGEHPTISAYANCSNFDCSRWNRSRNEHIHFRRIDLMIYNATIQWLFIRIFSERISFSENFMSYTRHFCFVQHRRWVPSDMCFCIDILQHFPHELKWQFSLTAMPFTICWQQRIRLHSRVCGIRIEVVEKLKEFVFLRIVFSIDFNEK